MMEMSFFAEMAWKSALIAGAALALGHALRSRSAADRALVLRIGMTMLLLLPLIALWLPVVEIVAFAAPEAPSVAAATAIPPELRLAAFTGAPAPAPEPTIWDDPTPLVVLAYLGGLAMVGSRLLAGLWMLARWTGNARPVDCPEWQAAFDRVRWSVADAEAVRLLASDELASPLSWGWRRPVILIDSDTLGQPEDAEAILAHEIAHIARRDWPVLMLSRIVATLFWFNPLVWMLEREIVQQAEEAADCAAAERVEPTQYAETLLSWARANTAVPANSIAPSGHALGRRIRAVLDRSRRERPSGSAWTAFAMLACLAIAAPVAAMQLVAAPPAPPPAPDAPEAPLAPAAPVAPDAPLPPAAPLPPVDIQADAEGLAGIAPAVEQALAQLLPQIPAIVAGATAAVDPQAMEQALDAAEAELRRMPDLSREDMAEAMAELRDARIRIRTIDRSEIEAAVRAAHAARAHAPRLSAEAIARIRRDAHAAARAAPRAVALSMAHGADGMLRGAEGMERGAREMIEEAEKLQDRDYRERVIARQRARGEEVTHEELLAAARGMREGAEGMREGAREMRESAERMRRRH